MIMITLYIYIYIYIYLEMIEMMINDRIVITSVHHGVNDVPWA